MNSFESPPHSSSESPGRRRKWKSLISPVLALLFAAPVPAQVAGGVKNLLPVDCGESVVTCYSGQTATGVNGGGFVVGIIDVRNPAANGAVTGANWAAPMYHNENGGAANVWNAKNLGQVFGITLDRATRPNIYVTATSIWGMNAPYPVNYAAGGPGAVYKLDGTTGAISVFAMLPNGFNSAGRPPSLGNICFDRKRNQFFVSNFENGLIYRLDMTGAWLGFIPYDHGNNARPNEPPRMALADDGVNGKLTALERRIWGLNVFDNRLYYAVWSEDRANPSTNLANEIWSAGIDGAGDPDAATARLEITLPQFFNTLAGSQGAGTLMSFSSPVSDISFTDNGRMLVAERTVPWFAHQSRVLEYQLDLPSGTWQLAPKDFKIGGAAASDSSAGGADYTCESNVWATGDYMELPNGQLVYGMTHISGNGNTLATMNSASYLVDFNGVFNAGDDKTQQGDVVVNRECCECVQISDVSVQCQPLPAPAVGTSSVWTFQVVNTMPWPIGHITFLQTPGFTVSPGPIVTLPTPLLPGNATNITVTLTPNSQPGPDHACLHMIFHSPRMDECCDMVHCVELAECCAEVTDLCLHQDPASPTGWTLCFNYTNLSPNAVSWIFAVSAPGYTGCIQPFIIPVSPALLTGQSRQFCVPVSIDPDCRKFCLVISGQTSTFEECCSVIECIEVPCPCIPKTWTLDADFDSGTLINVHHNPSNQLQLNGIAKPMPFVCVPCSGRGTVVRIDINGPNSPAAVLGEYLTAPDSFGTAFVGKNPSRTTVDKYGNVWVGNRNSAQKLDGSPATASPADAWGSVVRVGIVLGGTRGDVVGNVFTANPLGSYLQPPFLYSTCVDRDGDGYIKTSRGIGHILPWNNAGSVDTDGGVQTAEDECITIYTRVPGAGTRFLAIDCNNNLWTGGNHGYYDQVNNTFWSDTEFQAVDGVTGNLVGGTYFDHGGGGYGGLIDGFGNIWGAGEILRISTTTLLQLPVNASPRRCYGLGIDPRACHVFSSMSQVTDTNTGAGRSGILEWDPSGNVLFEYAKHGSGGICVDGNGHVWSAAGPAVYHLSPNGAPGTGHTIQPDVPIPNSPNPMFPGAKHVWGVAVDTNGHIWAADMQGNSAHRINFGSATVDKTIDLGSSGSHTSGLDAFPYNYSDMTGFVALGSTCREGSWNVLHDGGCDGLDWGILTWTALNTNAQNTVTVEIRADDSQALLPTHPFISVSNGQSFCGKGITGRWAEIRVTLKGRPCSTESPILTDIKLECCGVHDDPCVREDRPAEALKCPDNIAVVPAPGTNSVTLTLSAQLSDADGGPINVQWKVNNAVVSSATIPANGPPTIGSTSLTYNFPIGSHVVTLCVQSGAAWVIVCESKVSVGDQGGPVIGPVPGVDVLGWSAPMHDFLTTLEVTDDVTPREQLILTQNPAAGAVVGTGLHKVAISARDQSGRISRAETSFTVSPGLVLTSPVSYSVTPQGQPVQFRANIAASAPQAQGFAFILNGVVASLSPGGAHQGSFTANNLAPGSYGIQAVAYGPGGQIAYTLLRQFTVAAGPAPAPLMEPNLQFRGNDICICIPTVPGEMCEVQVSPDLVNWTTVPNGVFAGDGSVREIIIPQTVPPQPRQFFRVNRSP